MSANQPKIAIAVQKYYHPGQTFVNRHLKHLFGGNSCVVAERHYRDEPAGVSKDAFFMSDALKNPRDIVVLPLAAYRNHREHRTFRVPFGQNRQELIAYLKNEDAQIILSEFGSQSMLVADIGRELNIPVFCYFRGRDASYWIHNKTRVAAYQKIFPELAGIFAVSQFLLDNLASVGLVHPNAHVVPSGTDIELFKPAQKDPNLVMAVGRFVDKKYPELSIKSFLEASKNNSEARFEMIGDGPKLKDCRELVEREGASDRVIFHGKQNSEFIAEKLSHASIFMQHSVTDAKGEAEGLPSSIQEAMAAGCAILSTEHAGIPELVKEGQTGLLSPELDTQSFVENLNKLLCNPEETANMGRNARQVAEEKIDYRILYKKVETVMKASL